VGNISSDGAWNIVPRGVLVQGSLRTFNDSLREQALDRLRDLLREAQSEFEIEAKLDLVHGTVPLMNEPNVTRTVLDVGRELIGDKASVLGRPLTVSDDFANFSRVSRAATSCSGAAGRRSRHPPTIRRDSGSTRPLCRSASRSWRERPLDSPPNSRDNDALALRDRARVVFGLITGGRIGNLARLRFRWPWLIIAAVVVRESVVLTPLSRVDGARYAYVLALAAIVVWTIWQFDRVRGIWLITGAPR